MNALMICVAAAVLGTDVGWQRMPEGGMEYIIQLDPQTLETLRAGVPIESDIPPAAGDVRSYRIMVGKEKLPRDVPPASPPVAKPSPEPKPAEPQPAAGSQEPQPAATQASEPGGKRYPGRQAVYVEQKAPPAAETPARHPAPESEPKEPAKPWLPLTFTLLGLFASLGTNVYLGWIAWDSRRQWRLAVEDGAARENQSD